MFHAAFEPDSVKWSLLDEITNEYDVDQVARSLIPEGSGSDRAWSDYARTFFIGVVRRTLEAGIKDDAEVFRLITKASTAELKLLAKDTIAGPFLEDGNEKMFGSLRSVTAAAVRGLDYTTKGRGTPFSVRRWVRDGASRREGGPGGVLFLPYKAGEIAALKSIISAWMRIAIFEAMSRPEGDHRLWFVVDELDALGEIDGLKDALTRLRGFGGRCVLGFQSISQVSGRHVVEHAIMASEIERLADLQGYLKLASYPDWYRVALSRVEYPVRPRTARRDTEAGSAKPDAATAWPKVPPALVTRAHSGQSAPMQAAKSRVAAKRPRKSAVKAAEPE